MLVHILSIEKAFCKLLTQKLIYMNTNLKKEILDGFKTKNSYKHSSSIALFSKNNPLNGTSLKLGITHRGCILQILIFF